MREPEFSVPPVVWIPTMYPRNEAPVFAEKIAEPLCPGAVSISCQSLKGSTSAKEVFAPSHMVPSGLSPGYPAIAGVKSDRSSVEVVITATENQPTVEPKVEPDILMTPQSNSESPPLLMYASGTHQLAAHSNPYGSYPSSLPGITAMSSVQPSMGS